METLTSDRSTGNDGAVVKLVDVHKTYHTGEMEVNAVRGVSLEIHRAEFVALMGASGSGKSTLMNILGCLDRPTSGHYLLDDADVSWLDRDRLADIRNRKIGFVFQNFNLLPRTSARENVELPLLYSAQRLTNAQLREKADRVLASVGLGGREDHHPSQLSGGQQQRVAIARALINDPEVVLADAGNQNWFTRIYGESADYFDIRQWPLADGAPFTSQDVRSTNKVCVIGRTTATQIYGNENPIGQILRIKEVPFTITGVLTPKGLSTQGVDQDDI